MRSPEARVASALPRFGFRCIGARRAAVAGACLQGRAELSSAGAASDPAGATSDPAGAASDLEGARSGGQRHFLLT